MDILDCTFFFFCHLLSLPLSCVSLLPACVEPVSRSACVHGSGPRLSGQAANDIMLHCGYVYVCWRGRQKVTPLVSMTHYLSYTPSLRYESDLIVVMNICYTGKPKICAL